MAKAMSGAVRPSKSLLLIEYSLCNRLTRICCALVDNTAIAATMVPQKFIVVSCNVAIPTPNITTPMARASAQETFRPKNATSIRHTAGICNSLAS